MASRVTPASDRQRDVMVRIAAKVAIENSGCWNWVGRVNNMGYGLISYNNRGCLVHRLVALFNIPYLQDDLDVHHLCENPVCVNPSHLTIITKKHHIDLTQPRAKSPRKTHCIRGHAFTEGNTYLSRRGKRVSRQCRICREMKGKEDAKKRTLKRRLAKEQALQEGR